MWWICERFSKRLGHPTYHFVNYCKNTTSLLFASGFKSKLNYFLRTIPNIHHLLLPLERTIRNKLILAVKGCHICNDKERVLISLPIRYGGLAIHIFHKRAEIEFMSSSKITSKLTVYEGNLKKLNPLLPNVVKWSDSL